MLVGVGEPPGLPEVHSRRSREKLSGPGNRSSIGSEEDRGTADRQKGDTNRPAPVRRLSIVIPVYNESNTIERLLEAVLRAPSPGFEKEILVVDDASTDGTSAVLEKLSATQPFIHLRHAVNAGKGAAIRTALKKASGDAVLIQDADLEYDPADYPALLAAYGESAPIVYGSRNLNRTGRGYLAYYLGGRFLTTVLNTLFRAALTDINTGYKLFRRDVLASLPLRADRFDFCEEVTAEALKAGYSIREVPIHYHPRTLAAGKKIGLRDGLAGLRTIVRCRFT